jgi:hypothetical protein
LQRSEGEGAATRRAARPDDAWFTEAAIARIAACVSAVEGAHPVTARDIIANYVGNEDTHSLAKAELADRRTEELFETHTMDGLAFYRFAGAIELAAGAGYVDLALWEDRASFEAALRTFERNETASEQPADLTLIRQLIERLENARWRVEEMSEDSFYAFASYLDLTRTYLSNREARRFIKGAAENPRRKTDLSFLISPRHFAEALCTGHIAGFEAAAAAAGLSVLRYFNWLTEIAGRMAHDPALVDSLLRHARWSHHIRNIRQRFEVWESHMMEWGPVNDAERRRLRASWAALRPNARDLARLGIAKEEDVEPLVVAAVQISERSTAMQLEAQGRMEAARMQARKDLERAELVLNRHSENDWPENAERLCQAAVICESLGDVDGAAVILARFIEDLIANLGSEHEATRAAMGILAKARLSSAEAGAASTGAVQTSSAAERPNPPRGAVVTEFAVAAEPLRSHQAGESTEI